MHEGSSRSAEVFSSLMAGFDPAVVIVTAAAAGPGGAVERAGCLVGFSAQASIHPARMVVALSDRNRTTELAAAASHLGVHFLGRADLPLARLFGEETGDETDKLAACRWREGPGGVPLLEGTNGWAVLRLVGRFDAGDHILHLGEVTEAGERACDPPLRYRDVAGLRAGHPA